MVDKKTFTPFVRQCYVTVAVGCSVVGQGCLLGFPGVLLPQLQAPGAAISVSRDQASWIAAVSAISMLFGCFLIAPVMGRSGRRAAHHAVVAAMLLGWLIVALATTYEGLLVAKIVQGLAYGLLLPLRSILIGEYTSPRHRGGFLAVIGLAKTFGMLLVHSIGSVISYKITALVLMAFPVTSLVMTIYSPESPSWLATQGKYEECRKAFIWLRGTEETPELESIVQASKHLRDNQTRKQKMIQAFGAAAQKKELYKPVILMFALYILESFAGGAVMASYPVTVLNLLMGPDVHAHVWMVALDVQRLFFNLVCIYVISRVKRRTMLFTTGALCVGSLLAMATYVFLKTKSLLPYDSMWIPGILINLETFSVAMGMSPLPSVLAGEVFPLQYRSLGGSISLIICCGAYFLVLKTFPRLISELGFHGTFLVYGAVVAACLGAAWALLPETRGRTLQQVEEQFRGAPLRDPEAIVKETEPLTSEKYSSVKTSREDRCQSLALARNTVIAF